MRRFELKPEGGLVEEPEADKPYDEMTLEELEAKKNEIQQALGERRQADQAAWQEDAASTKRKTEYLSAKALEDELREINRIMKEKALSQQEGGQEREE